MDSRISLKKEQGGFGSVSWCAFVDGVFVCSYRLQKEAIEVAENHIKNKQQEENELWEYIEMEYGGEA